MVGVVASCHVFTSKLNATYIIKTDEVIYYAVSKNGVQHFKKLTPDSLVKLNHYGILTLSRCSDASGLFFRDYIDNESSNIECDILKSLSSRDLRSPEPDFFINYLRHVSYGWEYSESDNIYTLHVTNEMKNGPVIDLVKVSDDYEHLLMDMQDLFYNVFGLLIYMVADNDLYSAAIETINQLESAYMPFGLVYIYLDAPKGTPHEGGTLMRLVHDETPEIRSKVVISFGEVDSYDPDFFKKISRSMYHFLTIPSTLLWSHGTSWLPSFVNGDEINLTAFGKDESSNSSLNIEVVASATIGPIVFDSCRMASAEVLSCFEGRSIVAPSVDIEPLSYPYSDPEFLIALIYQQYEKVVDMIVEHNKKQDKEISMTYTSDWKWDKQAGYEFHSNFYSNFYQKAFSSYLKTNHNDSTNKLNFATMRDSLLPLGTPNPDKATLYYDLLSLIQELEKGSGKTELQDALKKSVYVRSTPTILNGQDSSKYCGVSCYVPYHYDEGISTELVQLNEYYLTLPWGATIGKYCKPLVPY